MLNILNSNENEEEIDVSRCRRRGTWCSDHNSGTEQLTNEEKFRPRGKERTEVWITQNKGKESENSYKKLKRSL